LRECRRVARVGARMVFTVIAPARQLDDSARQIAIESGRCLLPNVLDQLGLIFAGDGFGVLSDIDVQRAMRDSSP
jgi:uncharacterized membrane protein